MIKILNVAEKNDAAKNVAKIMSKSNSRMVYLLTDYLIIKKN
jgi:hypothetical protein